MSVTKGDSDCQPLFCLLVGARAISIALTAHQSFRNWIVVQSGFHKTLTIALIQQYYVFSGDRGSVYLLCLVAYSSIAWLWWMRNKIPWKFHRRHTKKPKTHLCVKTWEGSCEFSVQMMWRAAAPSSGEQRPYWSESTLSNGLFSIWLHKYINIFHTCLLTNMQHKCLSHILCNKTPEHNISTRRRLKVWRDIK